MRAADKMRRVCGAVALLAFLSSVRAAEDRPNIVVFVVDDLDNHMGSLDHMQFVQKRLVDQGLVFENAVVTTALCCPTRTTFLTGLLAHSSNYTSTMDPFGGYEPFWTRGFVNDYLPTWLKDAGYKTHFIGKLVNGVTTHNYHKPLPSWDTFDVLLLPYMYDYWNPVFSRNGQAPKHYRNQYQTDVITKKVLDVLDSTPSSHPFFLYVAPAAAHSTFKFPRVQSELPSRDPFLPYEALGLGWTYPEPSPRHKNLFPDAKVPRTPHFDPEIFEGKPSWHAHLRRKTPQEIEEMDKWYRLRLQTLQAVDESVEHIFLALERQGRLDNTYFVFLSDNGYHLGHLRLNVGKSTPYETDIRIPFIVRGPGVAKGAKSSKVITAADLAPTILKMAGVEPFDWMDGRPIAFRNNEEEKKREAFLVEYWDLAADEGFNGIYRNNQYKSVRLISESHNLYYAVWCTNETEFYDLKQDPWQLRNTVKDIDRRLQLRMEALVRVMKDCKGRGCHDPWSIIHPDGSVHSLDDAMSPEHDDLYKKIKPFRYKRCLRHMSPKNEDTRRVPDSGAHPPPVEVAKVNQQTGDVEWTQLSSSRAVKAPLEGPEIPLLKQTHGMPLDSHACSQPLLEKAKGTSFGFLDIPGYLVLRGWQATTMAAWNGLTGAFAWWNGWLVSEENLN